MDHRLFLLVLIAAACCINVAVAGGAPWPAAALAAYSLWLAAAVALGVGVLLPHRRPE
jgi:hypothetical protein